MIQRAFMTLCDRLEYTLSRWWGTSAYIVSMAFALYWGWDPLDRWIYISNAVLVVLLIGNARRSDKAMHRKLDNVDPREDHNRLEEQDEQEIEKA